MSALPWSRWMLGSDTAELGSLLALLAYRSQRSALNSVLEQKPQATLLTGGTTGLLEDSCPGSWMELGGHQPEGSP